MFLRKFRTWKDSAFSLTAPWSSKQEKTAAGVNVLLPADGCSQRASTETHTSQSTRENEWSFFTTFNILLSGSVAVVAGVNLSQSRTFYLPGFFLGFYTVTGIAMKEAAHFSVGERDSWDSEITVHLKMSCLRVNVSVFHYNTFFFRVHILVLVPHDSLYLS